MEYLTEYKPKKKKKQKLSKKMNMLLRGEKKKTPKKIKKFRRPKYREYIKSNEWKRRRESYYKKYKKECVVCKSKRKVGLHHLSYENLGREKDRDLVPLCWGCHEAYHLEYGTKNLKELTNVFIIEKQEEEFYRISKNI